MGRDGLQALRLHQGQLREGKEARPRHQDVPGKWPSTNEASSAERGVGQSLTKKGLNSSEIHGISEGAERQGQGAHQLGEAVAGGGARPGGLRRRVPPLRTRLAEGLI